MHPPSAAYTRMFVAAGRVAEGLVAESCVLCPYRQD